MQNQLIFTPRILIIIAFFSANVLCKAQIGEVLWVDNFDHLDNWNIATGNGSWGWGNGELEYYLKQNLEIVQVPGELGNSALKITAKKESDKKFIDKDGNLLHFTSGKIDTKSKVEVKYGVVETRVRIPNINMGGWPAIWLLGTAKGGWPRQGEIDLMEMGHSQEFRDLHDGHNGGDNSNNTNVNQMVSSNLIFFSNDAINPDNLTGAASIAWDPEDKYCRPYYNLKKPLIDRFLIYRMYWDCESIRFTVIDEGIEYDLYKKPFPITAESDEFRKPFYFLANLAIGGKFTNAYNLGDKNTGLPVSMPFPAHMYVDYLKVMKSNGQGEVIITK